MGRNLRSNPPHDEPHEMKRTPTGGGGNGGGWDDGDEGG